ncbi:peptidase S8 family domain protein [Gregarina niphandrodes]|uniref:subtilisin n=1 Tax=Gregarina niphandrodes TaxID=110365 RepID=A0A023BDP1_GRENI|nr:peptidase S8 family domain protein [Gregarina niphandrodes]EZG89043.1 peptidase S8 family domain protein [Gregarina niphandrodes]|eukprot:XP_011128512.1 peptidase S8 family domain protein [Gregarina niphandrodes]
MQKLWIINSLLSLISADDNVEFLSGPGVVDRVLSSDTEELLNSHLLFVYEDSGCRAMEGMTKETSNYPIHRVVALTELGRRLQTQMSGQQRPHPSRMQGIEFVDDMSPKLDTIYLDTLEMEIAKVPEGLSLAELESLSQDLPCVKFVARDDIKYVEDEDASLRGSRNIEDEIIRKGGPGDPLYRYQWALKGASSGAGFGINAEAVWKQYEPKAETLVAIIDSGCTQNHPDMKGQFWRNDREGSCTNGMDDDENGFVDDCWGWDFVRNSNNPVAEGTSSHGTAAAGIIAAKANNRMGIAGICPSCRLICLRFISTTEGTVVNEVRAIDYAIKMGARISNNSYGGYARHGSKVEKEAIMRAHKHGHLFVSSAGNNNLATDYSDYIHTPSGYTVPNILSVGASTESGRKTPFSNYGKETVHVFAPGRNIISTGKDGYVVNQGTSFAAPHVVGIAGLIWSTFPELKNTEVRQAIMESCKRTTDLDKAAACGGVVDAQKAMQIAQRIAESKVTVRQPTELPPPAPVSLTAVHAVPRPAEVTFPVMPHSWEVIPYPNVAPFFTINASSLYQVLPTAKKIINAPAQAFREVAKKAESVRDTGLSRLIAPPTFSLDQILDLVARGFVSDEG